MIQDKARGLTLVEVLVALVVLAIGVVAAAQLQAFSLRLSSQAEILKTSTQLAEGEVEWRRQTEVFTGTDMSCESSTPEGFGCSVDVEPCNAVGASLTLTCAPGLVNPVAYLISVTVSNARSDPFTLSTITTGNYVTGVIGTGEVDEEPGDTGDPSGDPDDPQPPAAVPCLKWHPNKPGVCNKWGD